MQGKFGSDWFIRVHFDAIFCALIPLIHLKVYYYVIIAEESTLQITNGGRESVVVIEAARQILGCPGFGSR